MSDTATIQTNPPFSFTNAIAPLGGVLYFIAESQHSLGMALIACVVMIIGAIFLLKHFPIISIAIIALASYGAYQIVTYDPAKAALAQIQKENPGAIVLQPLSPEVAAQHKAQRDLEDAAWPHVLATGYRSALEDIGKNWADEAKGLIKSRHDAQMFLNIAEIPRRLEIEAQCADHERLAKELIQLQPAFERSGSLPSSEIAMVITKDSTDARPEAVCGRALIRKAQAAEFRRLRDQFSVN
jgi:hypothetical protein